MTRFISCEFKVTKIGNWTLVQKQASKILKFLLCAEISRRNCHFLRWIFFSRAMADKVPIKKKQVKKNGMLFSHQVII